MTTELHDSVKQACEIATGRAQIPNDAPAIRVIGAEKDLNSRGRGPQWYRMVYRGAWMYASSDRLPAGNFRAADRRATVYGNVYAGEIVADHDRGGPINDMYLVCADIGDGEHHLLKLSFQKIRSGLRVALPNGETLDLPDPRSR